MWLVACLFLCLSSLWPVGTAAPPQSHPVANPYSASAPVTFITQRIEDVRLGQRLIAQTPEPSGPDSPPLQITDPSQWREYVLTLPKPTGGEVLVHLLEREAWLSENSFDGELVELNLPELGASGLARVTDILPCPEIEPYDGTGRQLVTGTFRHRSERVLDLSIEGEPRPVGVTANHPFWSEDRREFVSACDLRNGELLRTSAGTFTTVVGTVWRPGLHDVYNLQVDSEHVYHVGTTGVLVHNSCADNFPSASASSRQYWTHSTEFLGNKIYQRNDLIDLKITNQFGKTNAQLMRSGNAPIGPDGEKINLHHMLQTQDGPIAEVTQTFHRENYSTIHINTNSTPSGINRQEFNAWKRRYWINRVSEMEGDTP